MIKLSKKTKFGVAESDLEVAMWATRAMVERWTQGVGIEQDRVCKGDLGRLRNLNSG